MTSYRYGLFDAPALEEALTKAVVRKVLARVLAVAPELAAEFLRAGPYTTCLLHCGEEVAVGHSKRRPTDIQNPITGDTIALTRALVALDQQLSKGA